LANDLYNQLTQEGYKVFFSRITLEDKLGTAYEPYIFAALNSAKVMVVVGTKPEFFNAVWVKNEWSRYLALIKGGAKKTLIPAYRDMDPYDLPEEFSHLQAQDMGKLGFMQDLLRGIKKIIGADSPKAEVKETVVINNAADAGIENLLKRVFMFLEDGDWKSADEYCEKILDVDSENARAYLGKLMAELQVKKQEKLAECENPFDDKNNYKKVLRFADEKLASELRGYVTHIKERNEAARLAGIYNSAVRIMRSAKAESDYKSAAKEFKSIPGYKDSDALAKECLEKAEVAKKEAEAAKKEAEAKAKAKAEAARKEAEAKAEAARKEDEAIAEAVRKKAEAERIAKENKRKRIKKITTISAAAAAVLLAFVIVLDNVILPPIRYKKANEYMANGQYSEAVSLLMKAGNYKDSEELIKPYRNKFDSVISAGYNHTVGLKANGTVVATGSNEFGQCNVYSWTDIVAVSAGDFHTVGLKADGTVVAVGNNRDGRCDVDSWSDIVAISAASDHTVGLKADGTVVAVGHDSKDGECDVRSWTDIVAISAGGIVTMGLKSDGTVVAVGYNDGRCNVGSWSNIVAISAGTNHTVGLKANGKVVTAGGGNIDGRRNVWLWSDIVAIDADDCTVGLKANGKVVAAGSNKQGQRNVRLWSDIVAVANGDEHTVGLKADGTVVATGNNENGQCNVSSWQLLN
ncbi:MAG: TIR domain-containing protein, partial [Oscillospiraceae bacterium]|nr:TIR domain-containing protein [Oscillospiraceae bacterium]